MWSRLRSEAGPPASVSSQPALAGQDNRRGLSNYVTLYFEHYHEHVCVITYVNVYLSTEISQAWNSLNQTKAAVSIS